MIGQTMGCWLCVAFACKKKEANYWEFECTNCHKRVIKPNSKHKLREQCQNCYGMPAGKSGFNILISNYRRRCEAQRLSFELTEEEFKIFTQSRCFYCGSEPETVVEPNRRTKREASPRWGRYTYNGIDRTDNNKGYLLGNCVSCCAICNRAKKAMSQELFIKHIRKIVENSISGLILCLSQ